MSRKKLTTITLLFFLTVFTVRPSQAIAPALPVLLNPAVLGAVVVAGGIIAGTAAHYAPATYEAGQVAVDSVGTFSRTLYQAEKFAVQSGAIYVVGRAYNAAFSLSSTASDIYQWVKNHLSDVPLINSALISSVSYSPYFPSVGDTIYSPGGPLAKIMTMTTGVYIEAILTSNGPASSQADGDAKCRDWFANHMSSGDTWYVDPATQSNFSGWATTHHNPPLFVYNPTWSGTYYVSYRHLACGLMKSSIIIGGIPNASSYPPGVFNPVAFQAAVSALSPSSVAAETDKIIAANPSAVTGVPPWSQADTDEGWRLAHLQSDDSRYSRVPTDNNHGSPGCTDGQGL